MADRSYFIWAVVEAYDSDDLAEIFEDEKRLLRAEKSAETKAFKRKKRLPKGKEGSLQKLSLRASLENQHHRQC